MDSEGSSSGLPGSDNQDSNEPAPPGTMSIGSKKPPLPLSGQRLLPSSKGVENAKKRLRAFSIQKKAPITPSQLMKPAASGSTAQTVLIGRLSNVKVAPKVEDEHKKLPKPPKPGSAKRNFQDSYTDLQKRTLAEIEDMKRKMELVDLGIPLGLICPSSNNEKAMPTKAMPPIKSFLDASKVDEIIRDAKAAKAEGKEFKFDYQKLLPDYDNPFQRKKDEPAPQEKEEVPEKEEKYERHYTPKSDRDRDKSRDSSKRKSDRYSDYRRHSDYRKDDRDRYKEKRPEKVRDREKEQKEPKEPKSKESSERSADKTVEQEVKETDVNLNDYLVCDSWSLENDDKTSSPHVEEKQAKAVTPVRKETKSKETELPAEPTKKSYDKDALLKAIDSPKTKKVEKLQPVIDSFKFEIDPNDDEILDIFDEDTKLEKFAKRKTKKSFDYIADANTSDSMGDENFLESVINEIKQENLSEDDSQDKGLVEYDSPMTDYSKGQGTPELDDSMRANTSQSDYSDGYRSTDSKYSVSSYKSTESGYKSTGSTKSEESRKEPTFEKESDNAQERKISKATAESLDTWNFVLKICQPLLFRHDKKSCYKQTATSPALWWCARAAGCGCVRGRRLVLHELRAQRMPLVDRVYGCDQIIDPPFPKKRSWYPPAAQCLAEGVTLVGAGEGGMKEDDLLLDREYQRFMQAVCEGTEPVQSQSNTPVRPTEEDKDDDKKKKKPKLSSEGWSQESDLEEEIEKRVKKQKEVEKEKEKSRKRKRSSSTMSTTTTDDEVVQRKKKKKANKKLKSKLAKRARSEKKQLKKLKGKQKKKKKKKQSKVEKITEDEEVEEPKKKQKDKKTKKKQTKPKKNQKKKKAKAKYSSSSSSSSSSSESDRPNKSKKKKKEDAFDVNILNNIKTEKLTDDEKCHKMRDDEFSPRRQQAKRPEIINVKELQSDLGVQIKQEVEDVEEREAPNMDDFDLSNHEEFMEERVEEGHVEKIEFKEPQDPNRLTPQPRPTPDETNLSQCSSQESLCSETDRPHQAYEKDESHLRPSSQNSNYSFNDVIASQSYNKMENVECEKFEYEQENYEMYEQLAMAYQSDVASNQVPLPAAAGAQRIETVALRRRGEIKCDWRPGDAPVPAHQPPARSRWGLKPSEVNIVLTGGSSEHFAPAEEPVYQIESIANRNDNSTGYDEAYMDTYGAMDRLQYGDCFAARSPRAAPPSRPRRATLDDRIDQALRHTVLGDIAMEPENQEAEADKENSDKGILVTRPSGARAAKRVSFADGYKPGQDSDTEEPPIKKRKKSRRRGCAWPCPASHPDHVPLWDALPPPPPPASPPPPIRTAPPLHLLRRPPSHQLQLRGPHPPHKFDPSVPLTGFMPPEPPPGLISFPPSAGFP